MPFTYNATQFSALLDKYRGIHERLQAAEPVLLRMGIAGLREARRLIQSGGDGSWASNMAGNPLLRKEGTLIRSLSVGGGANVNQVTATRVRYGTQLPYAKWLQEGTGIYGPHQQPIVPTHGKVLAFVINGKTYFVTSVKGTQPRVFLTITDDLRATFQRLQRAYFFQDGEDD